MRRLQLENAIFSIKNPTAFEEVALEVFEFQFEHNPVYRAFCKHIGRVRPKSFREIPFLPISFFKSHDVIVSGDASQTTTDTKLFLSSGTTSSNRSKHLVLHTDVYKRSFEATFRKLIGNPEDMVVCALLPNYLEQGNSSLVYMVDELIQMTNHPLSGFFLRNTTELIHVLKKAVHLNKKVVLFGVAYALMDLAMEGHHLDGVTLIETGGMKGRKKEIVREELHDILKTGLKVEYVSSEYGMTELLSQAYLNTQGWFEGPEWMRVIIRDINDPFAFLQDGKSGGVNVIDFANLYSCSFIATDDLGVKKGEQFQILGRFDNSDIRGCNLLVV